MCLLCGRKKNRLSDFRRRPTILLRIHHKVAYPMILLPIRLLLLTSLISMIVFGQSDHNCTAILIQCVSGLRCSSFLSKRLRRRRFQALLHESPSLRPLRESRKMVSTGVEPSALLHDCFLKGALLHDCSELSCNSGRRILCLFPSREGNRISSNTL